MSTCSHLLLYVFLKKEMEDLKNKLTDLKLQIKKLQQKIKTLGVKLDDEIDAEYDISLSAERKITRESFEVGAKRLYLTNNVCMHSLFQFYFFNV